MLMVIFGAGASYDSDPRYPPNVGYPANVDLSSRPPLADELFANRSEFLSDLDHFPECKPIVPFLRHLVGSSIEEKLESLQGEAARYPQRAIQLAAVRFYLQVMISRCVDRWTAQSRGVTNYLALLDEILGCGHTTALLVTFNYDRLLERAVQNLTGTAIDSDIDRYINVPPFTLIKVHGSTNWGREVKSSNTAAVNDVPFSAGILIRDAAQLEFGPNYYVGDSAPVVHDKARQKVLMPAIAIPVQRKQQFECPTEHLDRLVKMLPEVRRILIVGWRAMDEHFLVLLREHLKAVKIQIVNGEATEAQQTGERLIAAGWRSKIEHLDRGFSSYVASRAGIPFLKGSL